MSAAPVDVSELLPGAPERPGLSYLARVAAADVIRETAGQALRRVAAARPDRPALMWLTATSTESMTWRALLSRATVAASRLTEQCPDRARVVLLAGNSVDWVVAMYGCALAGMPVVPLSPMSTADEIGYVLGDLDIGVVLVDQDVAGINERVAHAVRTAHSDAAVWGIANWSGDAAAGQMPEGTPDDEFLVQYTSGTTGRPKPASLSHLTALNTARFFAEGTGATPGDVWLNPLPVYHVGGFVTGVLSCLTVGACYVVMERFSADSALRAVRQTKPGFVGMVPTMLIDLLAEPGVSDADFASVRTVVGGATDVDPHLIEDVESRLGIKFGVAYGQSESPCIAMTFGSDSTEIRTRSLGHPLPGRDYCLVDGVGRVVPIGHDGELCVRGPLNMSGYRRADGTLDADTTDGGWRCTGDVCALDDAGILRFRGRIRDVIIRGGTNIYPAEIEYTLTQHPALAEVAVFGVPDVRLGERVIAAVIPVSGQEVDLIELAEFAREHLGTQKRPVDWLVVAGFPRTSSGKVRKEALREAYSADATTDEEGSR